jgi:hypothetical protein
MAFFADIARHFRRFHAADIFIISLPPFRHFLLQFSFIDITLSTYYERGAEV